LKNFNGIDIDVCKKIYEAFSTFKGQKIFAITPIEAGGVNSMIPLFVGAQLHMPVVDADGIGRAFPEIQMTTFTIGGIGASPFAAADERGNIAIFSAPNNHWTEKLVRSFTTACGGSIIGACYSMRGEQLKACAVKHVISLSEEFGIAIRTSKQEDIFLKAVGGYKIFTGKIIDILREVKGSFNFGKIIMEGIGDFAGKKAVVNFQNENLIAEVDGKIRATTPDLICIIDRETFIPIASESLRYGKRVSVVALKCHEKWRTAEGLKLVSPRYFGYDVDYAPVEKLQEEWLCID
jgi:DUF917 family protein